MTVGVVCHVTLKSIYVYSAAYISESRLGNANQILPTENLVECPGRDKLRLNSKSLNFFGSNNLALLSQFAARESCLKQETIRLITYAQYGTANKPQYSVVGGTALRCLGYFRHCLIRSKMGFPGVRLLAWPSLNY